MELYLICKYKGKSFACFGTCICAWSLYECWLVFARKGDWGITRCII